MNTFTYFEIIWTYIFCAESSIADEIKKLKEILDEGAITQEEYDAQKKKLLNQ
jgi:hypothetical protein